MSVAGNEHVKALIDDIRKRVHGHAIADVETAFAVLLTSLVYLRCGKDPAITREAVTHRVSMALGAMRAVHAAHAPAIETTKH